jgi:1,4-alpha-glucan branching enzyme
MASSLLNGFSTAKTLFVLVFGIFAQVHTLSQLSKPMKKITLNIISMAICLLCILSAYGQALTITPSFPTANDEITFVIDLKQVKDTRAAGLLGRTSDVYAWVWGGSNTANNNADFGPTGQSSFNQAFEPGKMTSLGNDKWSIKITPSKYLSGLSGKAIAWVGILVKSGNGTYQTEDMIVTMSDGKLSVSFSKPSDKVFFVNEGSTIPILAKTSAKATLTLSLNGTKLSTATNQDSISYILSTNGLNTDRQTVTFMAQTATETASTSFSFNLKPTPPTAQLPANVQDGINYLSDNSVVLSLFAPNKSFVYLLGDFNNWESGNASLMNRTPDGQRYWLKIDNLTAGKEYAFQYLVDGVIAVGDPYSEKILDRNNDQYISAANYPNPKTFPAQAQGNIVSVLQTGQKAYNWQTKNFKRPTQDNLVIYELHIRDFVGTQWYKTVGDSLNYLKKLGVNCIELMPIMEFTGNDSWGYNPIYYTAPDKAYGTKEDLKAFIDKCHQNGIAVVLDMVLNQADYEFPYVKMYWDGAQPSKDSPFFNQQATHPYSVFFDFNHESAATKAYVKRVCQFWIQEYQFDGYRFDLSKGFTQRNSGTNVALWGNYDASRIAIWKRIYDEIRSYDLTAYIILEHFADNSEEKELADYGMMLWGNVNYDYRNAVKGNQSSFSGMSYRSRSWNKPALIGYMESHDEERMAWDAFNNGLSAKDYAVVRDLTNTLDRLKAAAALMITIPGPKMIWQFGELGYDVSIDQNGRTGKKPIRWEYYQNAERLKLYKVFAELNKLKTTQEAFRTTDFTLESSSRVKTVTLNHSTMKVHIIGNFDIVNQTVIPNFPQTGNWYDYFTGTALAISDLNQTMGLRPGEFHVYTSVQLPKPEANLVPWTAYSKEIVLANEPLQEGIVNVFPNPNTGLLQLQLNNNYYGLVEVTLSDMAGRDIAQTEYQKIHQADTFKWNISQIATGTYLLHIRAGSEKIIKKVVKL